MDTETILTVLFGIALVVSAVQAATLVSLGEQVKEQGTQMVLLKQKAGSGGTLSLSAENSSETPQANKPSPVPPATAMVGGC